VTPWNTLSELRIALNRQLDDPGKFYFVNTRLILSTGVNLNQLSAEANTDPARIAAVTSAIVSMGIMDGKVDASHDR
jgi:hypothetical protein